MRETMNAMGYIAHESRNWDALLFPFPERLSTFDTKKEGPSFRAPRAKDFAPSLRRSKLCSVGCASPYA